MGRDYEERTAVYSPSRDGVTLEGTLSVPGAGPRPAAVLVTGSGAVDRDSSYFGHRPFFVLAEALARRGIVVLRSDPRGRGRSTGSAEASTLRDRAGDTLAAIEFLRGCAEVDPQRIGLIGHSEGALVAGLAAAQRRDVAFLVLLAGTGLPVAQTFLAQGRQLLTGAGASEEFISRFAEKERRLFDLVAAEPDDAAAEKQIQEIETQWEQTLTEKQKQWLSAMFLPSVKMRVSRWLRDLTAFDPRPVLSRVHCPVLAMVGDLDRMVPPDAALEAIGQALAAGGNCQYQLRKLPGITHWLRAGRTGMKDELPEPGETVARTVLESVGDWVESCTGWRRDRGAGRC